MADRIEATTNADSYGTLRYEAELFRGSDANNALRDLKDYFLGNQSAGGLYKCELEKVTEGTLFDTAVARVQVHFRQAWNGRTLADFAATVTEVPVPLNRNWKLKGSSLTIIPKGTPVAEQANNAKTPEAPKSRTVADEVKDAALWVGGALVLAWAVVEIGKQAVKSKLEKVVTE